MESLLSWEMDVGILCFKVGRLEDTEGGKQLVKSMLLIIVFHNA